MILKDVRIKFRELSGRYDLVNDDFSDNGANFFINQASRWLDRTIETSKTWASHMQILSTGSWYATFPEARSVKEVWISTTTARWQLVKKRIQDLIAAFYTSPPANWSNGTPSYYSPTLTRHIPENISPATLATFTAYIGVLPVIGQNFNTIILSTPIDQSMLVEVVGLFYSRAMAQDTDDNYWSVNNPLLLIEATMRLTHIISGNKPLLDLLDRSLDDDLIRLDKDLVEQEIAELDQMEG